MKLGRYRILPPGLLVLVLVTARAATQFQEPSTPPGPYKIRTLYNVPVPMRDGVKLSADVYLPVAEGKFPVLVTRTPYDSVAEIERNTARYFASYGYAVVVQDVRGRYDSEGIFYPFLNEAQDGYDTQQWCAEQPWSNGAVGTYGGSYVAATQWLPAPLRHPHLKAMVSFVGMSDPRQGWVYGGGAFMLSMNLTWGAFLVDGRTNQAPWAISISDWHKAFLHLPVVEQPGAIGRKGTFFKDWLEHAENDEYWSRWSNRGKYSEIDVPVLHIGGWYDTFRDGTLENFTGMVTQGRTLRARQSQKLIMGPWYHYFGPIQKVGEVDFGEAALINLDEIRRRWFDYWLKGIDNGVMNEPPVKLFVMGDNQWRDEREWPLARAQRTPYYFQSNGHANSAAGDGVLSLMKPTTDFTDRFTYDPNNPVPTQGGNSCCTPQIVPEGAWDQRKIEARQDVLVYTGAALEKDLEVTGPVKVVLYASSSAPDTDFTAKLVDVYPDGYAQNVTDGIIRARYRNGGARAEFLEPGQVYKFEIDLGSTSHVFKSGHRLRVEISSSNFPRFDRNLNTKDRVGFGTTPQVAEQTVYQSEPYPSHILLPVIPR